MIEFLLFFVYVTVIFFLPNELWVIFSFFVIMLAYSCARKVSFSKIFYGMARILPFVLLIFGFNIWLDDLKTAIFVAWKLLIVCWTTLTYAQTLSLLGFVKKIENLLSPLRRVDFDVESVSLVICLALSMIPILRREVIETKYAMRAKGMDINVRNIHYVVTRMFVRLIRRVDELDMALKAKGVI